MPNFLLETERRLGYFGYSWDRVRSVQLGDRRISIGRFRELADRNYDAGYGSQFVLPNIVVLLDDGSWLERAEYDGSEWWRHVSPPRLVDSIDDSAVETLFADWYDGSEERHRDNGGDGEDE